MKVFTGALIQTAFTWSLGLSNTSYFGSNKPNSDFLKDLCSIAITKDSNCKYLLLSLDIMFSLEEEIQGKTTVASCNVTDMSSVGIQQLEDCKEKHWFPALFMTTCPT